MTPSDVRITPQWRAALAAAARFGEQAFLVVRPLWHAVFTGLLVGGVLVAPVLATLALVGLFAPQLAGAHRAAPALIFVSLAWLALAIFGAHMQVEQHTRDEADSDPQ